MSANHGSETTVGAHGGLCNRTACRAPGATWYNKSTRKHYCDECAHILNTVNDADARRLGVYPLCVQVTPEPSHV